MNVALFLEIKQEYTEHLIDILTPFIYEGLHSIYKEAVNINESGTTKDKTLLIFQKLLMVVDTWTQHRIEEETNRIKQMSGSSEYLDDLIRGVIKSNIILLTYSNNISNVVAQTFYDSLSTPALVHRCYIECAKDSHNNPFLFFHEVSPMDLKRNQVMIEKNIQTGIIRGIRKILPISLMLKEFLCNSINIIAENPQIELVGQCPNNGNTGAANPNVSNVPNATNPTNPNQQDPMVPQINQNANPNANANQGLPVKSPNKSKTPQKSAPKPNGETKPSHNPTQKTPQKQVSDKKQEMKQNIMEMVKTENGKSDKEKVMALIHMNKIVAGEKKIHQGGHGYTPNHKLNDSGKAIINVDFNEYSSEEKHSKSSSKSTSIPSQPNTRQVYNHHHTKSEYIEEYGMPTDQVKKNRKLK